MTKYLEYTVQARAPLGNNAPATLRRTETIISFEDAATFGKSGKHYAQGSMTEWANLDTVAVSPEFVKVTTASGSQQLPMSYDAFRNLFNRTADGAIIDPSDKDLLRKSEAQAPANDSVERLPDLAVGGAPSLMAAAYPAGNRIVVEKTYAERQHEVMEECFRNLQPPF